MNDERRALHTVQIVPRPFYYTQQLRKKARRRIAECQRPRFGIRIVYRTVVTCPDDGTYYLGNRPQRPDHACSTRHRDVGGQEGERWYRASRGEVECERRSHRL